MSKLGKRLIASAKEARAIVQGKADPATYRVHVPARVDVASIRKRAGRASARAAAHHRPGTRGRHACVEIGVARSRKGAARGDMARKVHDSYAAFRERAGLWSRVSIRAVPEAREG